MPKPTRDRLILEALQAGDLYADGETGQVRNRRRPLGHLDALGYVRVTTRGKSLLAHRVVWLAHNAPISGGLFINHRNGIRHDNRLQNLELVTHRSNLRHACGLPYEGIGYADDDNIVTPEWYREALRLAADPDVTRAQIQALKTKLPLDDSAPAVFTARPLTRRLH